MYFIWLCSLLIDLTINLWVFFEVENEDVFLQNEFVFTYAKCSGVRVSLTKNIFKEYHGLEFPGLPTPCKPRLQSLPRLIKFLRDIGLLHHTFLSLLLLRPKDSILQLLGVAWGIGLVVVQPLGISAWCGEEFLWMSWGLCALTSVPVILGGHWKMHSAETRQQHPQSQGLRGAVSRHLPGSHLTLKFGLAVSQHPVRFLF